MATAGTCGSCTTCPPTWRLCAHRRRPGQGRLRHHRRARCARHRLPAQRARRHHAHPGVRGTSSSPTTTSSAAAWAPFSWPSSAATPPSPATWSMGRILGLCEARAGRSAGVSPRMCRRARPRTTRSMPATTSSDYWGAGPRGDVRGLSRCSGAGPSARRSASARKRRLPPLPVRAARAAARHAARHQGRGQNRSRWWCGRSARAATTRWPASGTRART
jgi:hypothetical protein